MKRVPSLYRYLQFKIKEHSNNGSISYERVIDLFSIYHIPKKIRVTMIAELEELKLLKVKKVKKDRTIIIINCKIGDEYIMLNRLSRRNFFVNNV